MELTAWFLLFNAYKFPFLFLPGQRLTLCQFLWVASEVPDQRVGLEVLSSGSTKQL